MVRFDVYTYMRRLQQRKPCHHDDANDCLCSDEQMNITKHPQCPDPERWGKRCYEPLQMLMQVFLESLQLSEISSSKLLSLGHKSMPPTLIVTAPALISSPAAASINLDVNYCTRFTLASRGTCSCLQLLIASLAHVTLTIVPLVTQHNNRHSSE